MRTPSFLGAAIAVSMLVVLAPSPGASPAATVRTERSTAALAATRVKMVDDKFKSQSVTIAKGAKVKWVNKGNNPHTTTGPGWDATLSPGETYSRKFKKAGTYKYKCSFHSDMVGKVVVTS